MPSGRTGAKPKSPGLRKARGVPLVERRTLELYRSSDYRWRELFECADVMSEGATRTEPDGATYYGSTSVLLTLMRGCARCELPAWKPKCDPTAASAASAPSSACARMPWVCVSTSTSRRACSQTFNHGRLVGRSQPSRSAERAGLELSAPPCGTSRAKFERDASRSNDFPCYELSALGAYRLTVQFAAS
jgi:hypothetical protein